MIQAVLLDIDGTLIDSNEAHARSWMEALDEAGIAANYLQIRRLIGMGGDQLLPRVANISDDSDEGRKISKRRGEIFRSRYLPQLKVFPGVRELLQKMRDNQMQIVISSSASQEDLKSLLKKIQIGDLIQNATSADDADNSKPSPDLISAALKKTNANPQEALMLGDTPYDIQAAAKAGVRTVAFTCGGWGVEELKDAIAIYEGPWQLLKEFENSPLKGHFEKQILASKQHFQIENPPI